MTGSLLLSAGLAGSGLFGGGRGWEIFGVELAGACPFGKEFDTPLGWAGFAGSVLMIAFIMGLSCPAGDACGVACTGSCLVGVGGGGTGAGGIIPFGGPYCIIGRYIGC